MKFERSMLYEGRGLGAWIDNHILFKLMKSGDCHTTNRKGIEGLMEATGFTITDSRQVRV